MKLHPVVVVTIFRQNKSCPKLEVKILRQNKPVEVKIFRQNEPFPKVGVTIFGQNEPCP